MNRSTEKARGLDELIPELPPEPPPKDIHHQLPNHSGNELLSKEEIDIEAVKQVQQAEPPLFDSSEQVGALSLTHAEVVHPDNKKKA